MRAQLARINRQRRETGASSVEYGLIAVLIAAVVVVAVIALGLSTNAAMESPCDALAEGGGAAQC